MSYCGSMHRRQDSFHTVTMPMPQSMLATLLGLASLQSVCVWVGGATCTHGHAAVAPE